MELFGKFRVAVGGRTPGSDGSHRGVCSKTKETVDPVFWHSRPSLLYQEVMASYHLTALVDGGVVDGVLAATACLKRVPYFGLALTQQHLEKVTERIVHVVMNQMLQTESGVFEPKLAALVGKSGQNAQGAGQPQQRQGNGQQETPAAAGSGAGGQTTGQAVLDDFKAGCVVRFVFFFGSIQKQNTAGTCKM